MKSMTGYASISFSLQSKRYRLEIQTLNKKGLEIQTDLPGSFLNLNIPIRLFLSTKIERGSVLVRLKEEVTDKQFLNIEELKSLKKMLESTAQVLGFESQAITFPILLDKCQMISSSGDVSFEDVEPHLMSCLTHLLEMRRDEGQRLKNDLSDRFDLITNIVHEIELLQKEVPLKLKQTLLERITALEIQGHDEDRLLKEVIYYVEKQDVTEEITRLKSHLTQMKAILQLDQAIGRKLEFLTQECFRELNTLCAKTAQLPSINLTLVLKTEFEKIKEQIMNIE